MPGIKRRNPPLAAASLVSEIGIAGFIQEASLHHQGICGRTPAFTRAAATRASSTLHQSSEILGPDFITGDSGISTLYRSRRSRDVRALKLWTHSPCNRLG